VTISPFVYGGSLRAGRDRSVVKLSSGSLIGPVNAPTVHPKDFFVTSLRFGADNRVVPNSHALLLSRADVRSVAVDAQRVPATQPVFQRAEHHFVTSAKAVKAVQRNLQARRVPGLTPSEAQLYGVFAASSDLRKVAQSLSRDDYKAAAGGAAVLRKDARAILAALKKHPATTRKGVGIRSVVIRLKRVIAPLSDFW
jgi:hypothetical protein